MPEKTCTSSPNSRPRSSERGRASLLCPADLPGLSLAVAHDSADAQPRHAHDSLTLGLVTAGARRIETPGGAELLAAGEVFALPSGLAHACAPEADRCSYLVFSIEARRLPGDVLAGLPLRLYDPELAKALVRLAEAVEGSAGSLERQSLMADVLERLAVHAGAAQPPLRDENLAAAVRAARELLESEDGTGLSLPELAQACQAEAYALHRAFTRMVGLPPHAYQTHLRLRRAKELLRAGRSPADAALEAGFCDQSHLNRHFARLVGLTPAQYAKAHAERG